MTATVPRRDPPDTTWVKFGGVPHTWLLTTNLNMFGDTRTSFGDSRIRSSPLKSPGLV